MKFERINHIFMLILFIICLFSLGMVIITLGKEKIYVITTVVSYGIVLYDSIFMWVYTLKRLEKSLDEDEDKNEDKVAYTINGVPFIKK